MLEVARSRCPGEKTVFMRQTFTGLELPEQVDILTCNFDSLNYLTEPSDLARALVRFGNSLRPGGYAIFDMNTAGSLEASQSEEVMVHRVSAGLSLWESSWDAASRINTVRMTNFVRKADGLYAMSEEVHRERAYDLQVVEDALLSAGFARVESWDARYLSKVSGDTRRVQFLAVKEACGPDGVCPGNNC
jgi:SAM-dependent methyltransferase